MKVSGCRDGERLLSYDVFRIYSSCMYQPSYEEYKAKMARFLEDKKAEIYICMQEDRIIGMLVLDRLQPIPVILGIAVSEKERGKGVGRTLIRQVMDRENLKSIRAETDEDAIGFYRRCGFTEEKKCVEYPDGTAVRYVCLLRREE